MLTPAEAESEDLGADVARIGTPASFRELLELSWRRVARKSDIAVYEGKT